MKIILGFLLLTGTACFAQKNEIRQIASGVSIERLKSNLYYLASEEMEGRVMGSHGDTLASKFIAKCFSDNNVAAPYSNGKSYYQPIIVYRKEAVAPLLTIAGKNYNNWEGWSFPMRSTETVQLKDIPVVFAGYGITTDPYNDFENIDVKNKAVLLLPGQPRDSTGKYLLSGTHQPANIASAITTLRAKGASLVLLYSRRFTEDTAQQRRQAFLSVYKSPQSTAVNNLAVLNVSEDRVNELLAASNKTIKELEAAIVITAKPQSFELKIPVTVSIQMNLTEETAPNVIGFIKGTDTAAGYVILSAHHDHVGRNGKEIYYGAVDNASGTVALMETAILLNKAVQQGLRPKRSIVFASFTGEEKGLLGSYYFASHSFYPIEKTWAVLNIDMMGRVDTFYSGRRADSSYAYILVKDTLNRGLRTALFSANEELGKLKLDTHYEQPQFMQRRLLGSDQYPFYLKGIPFLRIDCGFSKDYHQPTDTPDKINYQLLADQTQLAFLTIWNIANN
jgi:hypothetical protein